MPRGLNKVMIIGNLGHAPELRYTAGGQAVTTLSVAVNRLGRDQAGNRVFSGNSGGGGGDDDDD